jgi:hypothetical protein
LTKRGVTIPSAQILGPGKVVAGIARVLQIIDDPELAWAFLSEEWPFENQTARPIDKLEAGKVEEVVDAAASFGTPDHPAPLSGNAALARRRLTRVSGHAERLAALDMIAPTARVSSISSNCCWPICRPQPG